MKPSEWSKTTVYTRTLKEHPRGWLTLRADEAFVMWEVVLVELEPVRRGTVFRDGSRATALSRAEREALAAYAEMTKELEARRASEVTP